jgi:hypothetical protein
MQEHNELEHTNNNQTDSTPLQPMRLTDILDRMFSLYWKHFRLFFGIIAVYVVLGLAIDQISALLITSDVVSSKSIAVLIITFLSDIVVSLLVGIGLAYAGAQVYLGRTVTRHAALGQASQCFWRYFGVAFLWGLPVAGLAVTIIGIPLAIYFAIRWGLYGLPVILEGSSGWGALTRSAELVKGSWGRVFGIALVIYLLIFMIAFILQAAFGYILTSMGVAEIKEATTPLEMFRQLLIPASNEIGWFAYTIRSFVQLCVSAFVMPIEHLGFTLLYFDQRIRKEGFGVERQITD